MLNLAYLLMRTFESKFIVKLKKIPLKKLNGHLDQKLLHMNHDDPHLTQNRQTVFLRLVEFINDINYIKQIKFCFFCGVNPGFPANLNYCFEICSWAGWEDELFWCHIWHF